MMDNETVNIDGVLKAAQKKLAKTYSFIRHLGGGEFSNVYLVKHLSTGQEHALKILDYHYLLQRLKKEDFQSAQIKFNEIKKRFITEAKLYKKIHHPNIVKIHDTGVISDETKGIEIPYMIMSYIRGFSLSDLLRKEAPFKMERALSITRDVLGALEAMHANNIIHRDIKPGNIMIKQETGEAVIIDFGIAKDIVGGTRLTTTGALLGSPMYMAPEQSMDSSNVGPYTDIYSYGAVLFEMLTGETPFQGSNFMEIMTAHRERPIPNAQKKNPHLSVQVTNILSTAMAKNPQDRFPKTLDFLDAFEKAITDPMAPFEPPRKSIRRFGKYYILLVIFLVLVLAGVFIIDPFGMMNVKKDESYLKPHESGKIKKEPAPSTNDNDNLLILRQIQTMENEFANLKNFLDQTAGKKEKIEKIQLFLNKYQELKNSDHTEATSMIKEAKQISRMLNEELEKESQFQNFVSAVKRHIQLNEYDKADAILNKARNIKDSRELSELSREITEKRREFEKVNGKYVYENIKDKINLPDFRDFKNKYPQSIYLQKLKEGLRKADPHLPPEKYWDAVYLNSKGYYEYTFSIKKNKHRMIFLPKRNLWINKYEISNRQFRNFLKYKNKGIPEESADKYIHNEDEYPAVVSYKEAEQYCQLYGLRLPRVEEWEYAAGSQIYTYPWGNQLPGKQGIWRANFDSLGEDGKIEKDKYNGTAPVKSFEKFSSPFGVVNMAGNVWEWVQGRILKGGSFLSAPEELAIRNSIAGRTDDTQGFRCVKDEE